ncbi:MAG: hypothetical protein E7437_05525 [Ruminococcaceae bacterium]|nr:hypothetical protein [Oscillospiraceae bacterium]
MTGAERGFLLLTSHLGDPERKPLTVAQFRNLHKQISKTPLPREERELCEKDLVSIGISRDFANRIVTLLEGEDQLDWYLKKAKDCIPITRASDRYPISVRKRLGLDSPGCLWARGDLSYLELPGVCLVGSRNLEPLNAAFAWEAGRQAAIQGYVLISGNANGADQAAQNGALENGGKVISVVADRLLDHPAKENVLYLSEEGYDLPFSAIRALSRNRVIHTLGSLALVAQCSLGKGGTWDGTVKNLKNRWTPVYCLDDGSKAMDALVQMGAQPISGTDLCKLKDLTPDIPWLFE